MRNLKDDGKFKMIRLGSKGFKIGCTRIKCMNCNFSVDVQRIETAMII